jgi:hypothetical protein
MRSMRSTHFTSQNRELSPSDDLAVVKARRSIDYGLGRLLKKCIEVELISAGIGLMARVALGIITSGRPVG